MRRHLRPLELPVFQHPQVIIVVMTQWRAKVSLLELDCREYQGKRGCIHAWLRCLAHYHYLWLPGPAGSLLHEGVQRQEGQGGRVC